ncbi:MAG: endolytic transglycosylase MltG [Gammaproteobacteria bacterium]|nr:endolytic transglycosylase MltG [Gammaproteobacteria bacterium]
MMNVIGKLIGFVLLLVSFVGGWFILEFQTFNRGSLSSTTFAPLSYTIKQGASLSSVANELQQQGLMEHPRYWVWFARWKGNADKIKAGEYAISPQMTPHQLLALFVSGKVIDYSLTIPEGWTFRQMIKALHQHDKIKKTLLDRDGKLLDNAAIMARLRLSGKHPEGMFYPDTYHFTNNTTDVAVLQRAYQQMQARLDDEWQNRAPNLPYKNSYEALIMASIIEKETAAAEEREQIAGVFVRRLNKRMRLQTDPTVIYGLGESFDGNIRKRDLRAMNPYNTYKIKGLPPTPIALPGGDSIYAALHPAPGKVLYFVSRGDGTHKFSATNEEHNAAVRKYQLKKR